tara:strand:- start:451 stop:1077 length:627 start_codon:yes stop_codon:yes gene_type:complete
MTTTKKKTTTRKKSTTATKKPAARKPAAPQKVPDLPTNPFVFEVFDAASKMRSKAKKIEVLSRYKHPSIMAVCIWNFDESVISLLPQGEVPYGSNIEDETATGTLSEKIQDAVDKMGELRTTSLGSQDQGKASIRKEYTKFYNFIKGGNDSLSGLRRETMFINILTGLHPLEAEILILTKDKKLTDKYKFDKDMVSEAYPEIIWGGRS